MFQIHIKKLVSFGILALMIIVAGCSTIKVPEATGGSRSDGVIELSYEYGMLESPKIEWSEADATARERCKAWGYSNAEPFGGSKEQCQAYNGYGNCIRQLVIINYQCTGGSIK